MKLLDEQLKEAFKEAFDRLFREAQVPPDDYRVFVNSASHRGKCYVQVVWDGFDSWSVTTRQAWIWERLRRILPEGLRKNLSMVLARSSKEFIVADELAYQANERY